MKPTIIINLKTYKQGREVIELAGKIQDINKDIIIGVQPTDINELSKKTSLTIFSQHVDYQEKGRNTGYILPEAIKSAGASGSFLNHSEHRISFQTIKKTIKRLRDLNLKSAVFVKNLLQAEKIQSLKPTYLIYESPELVSGNTPVSKAKKDIIRKISENISMPFLIGAGIKTNNDLKASLELGASGIAVSSAITTAKNPKKILNELLGKR